jgi:endoglucanase
VAEVKRRVDELVDVWKATFIRLDLESYASAGGRVHWQGILDDPGYLADVVAIVDHIAQKPGVYVLLALWVDPTFTALGWPTAATNGEWARLADTFKLQPKVLFGLCNEPQSNFDGAQDPQVWAAMNAAVQAIRNVEDGAGTPHHVVTAQATRGWSRDLTYYLTHPITAGGGDNVAYEVHVYNPQSDFAAMFEQPARTLPVVIGEFGPDGTYMTTPDLVPLMTRAEAAEIPYLAWAFHQRCDPSLLVDPTGQGCGVGMALQPTAWGQILKTRLATPW